jgi:hypothetical protein
MKPKIKFLAFAALAAGGFAVAPATAQNTAFTHGDLVLGFQVPSPGAEVVLVNVGNTAYFRDLSGNSIDFLNINATLASAAVYSASWASRTDLYASLAGVWSSSATNPTLTNLDPSRTIYISKVREIVEGSYGIAGEAQSVGGAPFVASAGVMTTASGNILNQNDRLETGPSASPNSTNPFVEDEAPSVLPNAGVQPGGNSTNAFSGGFSNIADQGEATSISSWAGLSNIEFALDVYRIQARNNISGQYGFGETNFQGAYLGTLAIEDSGDVSFIDAVPEPSSGLLMALAGLVLTGLRRRKTA